MRTLSQIETALLPRYSGPIKQTQGFDYIPWDETQRVADTVFGPLGWSVSTSEPKFTECTIVNKEEEYTFSGFSATCHVTIIYLDEETGSVQTCTRGGTGYANATWQGEGKNPMDLAVKAAASDAFSRVFKLFGDAFGLFLYQKDAPATGGATRSYPASSGKGPSEKQTAVLKKNIPGLTDAWLAVVPYAVWKATLDANFGSGITAEHIAAMEQYKPEPVPAGRTAFPLPKNAA